VSTLSVRVPNSLHRQLRELAQREGVSMNQLISSAVGETRFAAHAGLSAAAGRSWQTSAYGKVLRRVRDVAPVEGDAPPNKGMKLTRPERIEVSRLDSSVFG